MISIYKKGNYIIVHNLDVEANEPPKQYGAASQFSTREPIWTLTNPARQVAQIDPDKVDEGSFVKEDGETTWNPLELYDFLLGNTGGFNPALGGSGASYNARWDFDPFSATESLVIKNDTGLSIEAQKDSRGVGTFSLQFTEETSIDPNKAQLHINCCQDGGKFVVQGYYSNRIEFRSLNNAGAAADLTVSGVDIVLNLFE